MPNSYEAKKISSGEPAIQKLDTPSALVEVLATRGPAMQKNNMPGDC